MEPEPVKRPGRIGVSLIAGCVVGLPAGVVLSYLAPLPLFLGLFFFLMFGLMIGALMFRFGKAAAPVPRRKIWSIGVFVTLLIWATGLVVEYLDLPDNVSQAVIDNIDQRLEPAQREEIKRKVRLHVISELSGQPFERGRIASFRGFPAYLRWAATDGTMSCPRFVDEASETFVLGQRRIGWLIRVFVSAGLLAFTILTQFMGLAARREPPSTDDSPA